MEESYQKDITPYGVEFELHHYVPDYDPLMSILGSKTLWASSARHLNDTTEFAHALPTCYAALDAITEPELREHVELLKGGLRDQFGYELFVTCFSRKCDIRSQWDDYANQQRGYVITFDSLRLSAMRFVRLMPVEYDPAVQKRRVEAAVDRARQYFRRAGHADRRRQAFNIQSRFVYLGTELFFLCATFKDTRWQKEQEWRLIYARAEHPGALPLFSRTRGAASVPYVALNLLDTYKPSIVPTFAAVRAGPLTGFCRRAQVRRYLLANEPHTRWEKQARFVDTTP